MKYDNNDDQGFLWSSLRFGAIVYNRCMGDFQIHKLHLETLGEYLTCIRTELGYSRAFVADESGVHMRYVEALEQGMFTALPEPVYVVGFLRKIASVYEIDPEPLVAEFHREVTLTKDMDIRASARSWKTIAARLTPRRWALVTSCTLGGIFIAVCIFQILAIGRVPTLSVHTPKQDERIQNGTLLVSGEATPGSEVVLNGQVVFVGSDGAFSNTMSVLPGTQTIEVIAKSRFGNQNKKLITVVVDDPQTGVAGPVSEQGGRSVLAKQK